MIGGFPSKAAKPEVILRVAARIEHGVVLRQIGDWNVMFGRKRRGRSTRAL